MLENCGVMVRSECWEFSPRTSQWRQLAQSLENRTGYPASVTDLAGQGIILAGGRDYVGGSGEQWRYYSGLSLLSNNRWTGLGHLPHPLADFCLVITDLAGTNRLWAIGGSNVPER